MVLIDYIRNNPKSKFDILYFNHGTPSCLKAEKFLDKFCSDNGITLIKGYISRERAKNESQEEYWRNERYNFFSKYSSEPIILAHHLNDCVETWVMTSLRGNPSLIPYHNPKYNIYRPFLMVSKKEITEWSKRKNVEWVLDSSNNDTSLNRNYVRHIMMEQIRVINPGIEKTIAKKILESYKKFFLKTK